MTLSETGFAVTPAGGGGTVERFRLTDKSEGPPRPFVPVALILNVREEFVETEITPSLCQAPPDSKRKVLETVLPFRV
jgi:hypothetical protein